MNQRKLFVLLCALFTAFSLKSASNRDVDDLNTLEEKTVGERIVEAGDPLGFIFKQEIKHLIESSSKKSDSIRDILHLLQKYPDQADEILKTAFRTRPQLFKVKDNPLTYNLSYFTHILQRLAAQNPAKWQAAANAIMRQSTKIDLVYLISSSLPDIKESTQRLASISSSQENEDDFKRLIQRGANVDTSLGLGLTHLHETESPGITSMLIRAGASLNKKDGYGKTPLECTTERLICCVGGIGVDEKRREMLMQKINILLENGANPNIVDYYNNSPLSAALDGENYNLVQLLLSYGANPIFIKEDSLERLDNWIKSLSAFNVQKWKLMLLRKRLYEIRKKELETKKELEEVIVEL